MLRLTADEDFNNRILRGLIRRQPELDIVRAQDAGLSSKADPEVLEWSAKEGRVLLTHDVTTMKKYADARIAAGLTMPVSLRSVKKFLSVRLLKRYYLLPNIASTANGKDRSDSSHSDNGSKAPHAKTPRR